MFLIDKKFFAPLAILLLLGSCSNAQHASRKQDTPPEASRPKLIIGITVDQMRADYIDKYWNDFSEGGFKRLVREGFACRNMHYNYMPTFTGPGHASIFTGTTPCFHGIVANDWYSRSLDTLVYCARDFNVNGIGTTSVAGKMSPVNLLASTLGDELKLFSNNRSKVIGIAMKDRGAILPAGRTANGAYWYAGGQEDAWITSSWYMNTLPSWVTAYNALHRGDACLHQGWNLSKPESDYDESQDDNNPFEAPFKGTIRPVFPYLLDSLRAMNGSFDLIKATPWGNTLTVEFAKAAIQGESLGQDEFTDMLCMSFSSPDYIGHQFGISSREMQDCYLKLDLELAGFIDWLDATIGRNNYLLFLSADHGGAPTPSSASRNKYAAGYWKSDSLENFIQTSLMKKYGEGRWVLNESNQNIYLNRALIASMSMDLRKIQNEVADLVRQYAHVLYAYTASDLNDPSAGSLPGQMVKNGFLASMNGDVVYIIDPGYIEYAMTGTTHGSPFDYDTHVPALFFGSGVQPGETSKHLSIPDIAATISALARFPFPNACTGEPIESIVR